MTVLTAIKSGMLRDLISMILQVHIRVYDIVQIDLCRSALNLRLLVNQLCLQYRRFDHYKGKNKVLVIKAQIKNSEERFIAKYRCQAVM